MTCTSTEKNDKGEVVAIHGTVLPASLDPDAANLPKAKATLHWVSAQHAVSLEARLYERLFSVPDPADEAEGKDWKSHLNPDSLEVRRECRAEPSLIGARVGAWYQFERLGYFCVDPDTVAGRLVVNRTVTLKDAWAKIQKGKGDIPLFQA